MSASTLNEGSAEQALQRETVATTDVRLDPKDALFDSMPVKREPVATTDARLHPQ